SRARQTAGLARPQLRVVIPPGLPESLAVPATARLRAAGGAEVDLAWLELALDPEFSLISTWRTDAGLGWLTAGQEAVPDGLEMMIVDELEPEVWIPAAHPAARCGVISLQERPPSGPARRPAPPPTRGRPPPSFPGRDRRPGVEHRPPPPATATALRHRREPDRAGASAARPPHGVVRPAGMTMSRFWILPVAPLARWSTSHRCRGYLEAATWPLT